MKNIGNSILPSSNPRILQPMKYKDWLLVVVPDEIADTYRLILKRGESQTELASHPNGYSCHNLAKRIIAGNLTRITEQAEYIVRCGGTTCNNLIGLL